jgi:hypothetical protein
LLKTRAGENIVQTEKTAKAEATWNPRRQQGF